MCRGLLLSNGGGLGSKSLVVKNSIRIEEISYFTLMFSRLQLSFWGLKTWTRLFFVVYCSMLCYSVTKREAGKSSPSNGIGIWSKQLYKYPVTVDLFARGEIWTLRQHLKSIRTLLRQNHHSHTYIRIAFVNPIDPTLFLSVSLWRMCFTRPSPALTRTL